MRKTVVVSVMLMVFGSIAWLAPSAAAAPQNEEAACRKAVRDYFASTSGEGTYGDYMSDGILGNEPNPTNVNSDLGLGPDEINAEDPGSVAGYVVPSQSPGPQLNNSDGRYGPADYQADVHDYCAS